MSKQSYKLIDRLDGIRQQLLLPYVYFGGNLIHATVNIVRKSFFVRVGVQWIFLKKQKTKNKNMYIYIKMKK